MEEPVSWRLSAYTQSVLLVDTVNTINVSCEHNAEQNSFPEIVTGLLSRHVIQITQLFKIMLLFPNITDSVAW